MIILPAITLNFFLNISSLVKEFNGYRARMNEVILGKNNLVMKRLWNLDTNTYEYGGPGQKDERNARIGCPPPDCIKFHLGKAHDLGVTTGEMYEIFAVANIVGGTIVIPHTRRAAEYWGWIKYKCSIVNVRCSPKESFGQFSTFKRIIIAH